MNYDVFLSLVRLGVGNASLQEISLPEDIDWDSLKALSEEQGLVAIVLDGMNKLPSTSVNIPGLLILQWTGEVIVYYESLYEEYQRVITELARFYNKHQYRLMVIKGYACSINWPRPEHRPIGDIDIWLFGDQRSADNILERETGIKVDNSEHHHTVFSWRGFLVENHYDFINVHHHKSNASLEKLLKELGQDDSHFVTVNGEKVFLPSPNLHALFLLRHTMLHFSVAGITLRQLLDWAFYVKVHGSDIDLNWLVGVLEEYGMKELFDIFNAICVEDLGFDTAMFPPATVDKGLKERVLQEILSPAIPNDEPKSLIRRVLFKLRRWKANKWKHQLCFNDSMWSAFWAGVWNHLLKPSSI